MADNPATIDRTDTNPAHQTGEDKGKIKKPQQTDATMAEKDLPRGSEKETHARK
jgi:hypothetical protein